MEPNELIQKTRDFLADPAHWTKNAYGRDENTRALSERHAMVAVSCCLAGALFRCSDGGEKPYERAYNVIGDRARDKGFAGLMNFNDDPSTTHEDVLALLDEAKEICNAS